MSSALATGQKPKRKKNEFENVSRQQRWKRQKQVHSNISHALSFLEGDDIQPLSVTIDMGSSTKVLDLQTGEYKTPDITNPLIDSPELALFVKDRFGLSDMAYHELAMVCRALPTLSKLKGVAKHFNSQWELQSCPENDGIQQSFKSRLTTRVTQLVEEEKISPGDRLKVKLSGDGTKICRKLNLINITFTLLNEGRVAMTPSGNHTLAIINETESYDRLKVALEDIITEVYNLDSVDVNGNNFEIDYFLCADLKYLAMVCGIGAANSTHTCIWCVCPSSERANMEKVWSLTDIEKGARTVDSIISCCEKPKSKQLGCINPPLFKKIAVDHIIPDILHLYLRITDVLFDLLISDIRRHDEVTKTSSDGQPTKYLEQLEFFINDTCKISFKFSVDKETKKLKWRDLMGPEKRVFF